MKNKYFRHSKISESQFRQILRLFAADQTATRVSKETGVSLHSTNAIYQKIRRRLAEHWEARMPSFSGAVQVHEHYWGPRGVKGPPGRGASNKILVLGIMDSEECMYTTFISDCRKITLHSRICQLVRHGTPITTTRWKGYEGLNLIGYPNHHRVRSTQICEVWDPSMSVDITSFWKFAHSRIAQFGGVPMNTLPLHILESEFRWNHRRNNLYKVLLGIFQANPL